jgi:5'-nucleotidase
MESPAVNLVADAQWWSTSWNGAEIAFMNPGGVRSDLLYLESAGEGDGIVTLGEVFTFQPFGNILLTFADFRRCVTSYAPYGKRFRMYL